MAFLDSNNISYFYDEEYFEDLIGVGGNPLRPDFIIPKKRIWIEYDGEFHFRPIFGHVRLLTQQKRDSIRDEWCKRHDVNLIVLYPNDLANLDQALKFCLQRL